MLVMLFLGILTDRLSRTATSLSRCVERKHLHAVVHSVDDVVHADVRHTGVDLYVLVEIAAVAQDEDLNKTQQSGTS